MKTPIQYSYALTLGIVVMLALLLAIYGSFEFADRLVKPIESLEKETDKKTDSEKRLANKTEYGEEDEITVLVNSFMAAQKEAAWSDVAKRMAHEINNPLTPIQLSAERIQKNSEDHQKKKISSMLQPKQSLLKLTFSETWLTHLAILQNVRNLLSRVQT